MNSYISFFFSLFLAVPAAVEQDADRLTGNAGDVIWQLNLKNDQPTDYQLQFTRVVKDENKQSVLEANSRNDNGEWHSCITLPKGLLKTGESYFITLDYEIIDSSGESGAHYPQNAWLHPGRVWKRPLGRRK